MRSPAYLTSLVAALLSLIPAVIRLYESVAGKPAALAFYLAWLVSWTLTATSLLWTAGQRTFTPRYRLALTLCGAGMLWSLVFTLAAAADPPTPIPALLAMTGDMAIAAGALIAFLFTPHSSPIVRPSWIMAGIGALLLAVVSLVILGPDERFNHLALPGGCFLLGAGISLALGHWPGAAKPSTSASQEP